MPDTIDTDEVWELLGRIRVALMEFIPEHALDDEVETFEDEVREIEKGIRMLGEGRERLR